MTQQIGFASVSYFDPTADQKTGPFEKMIQWTVLIMILTTGALIPMFKGVLNSFFQRDNGKYRELREYPYLLSRLF